MTVSELKTMLLVYCGVGHCLNVTEVCSDQGLLMRLGILPPIQSSLPYSPMSLLLTSQHGNKAITQGDDEPTYLVVLCYYVEFLP